MNVREIIAHHPFWTCEMDQESVRNVASAAQVANDGRLLVQRDGSFQWASGGSETRAPLTYAQVSTDRRGLSEQQALSGLFAAIEEQWQQILEQVRAEAFVAGRNGLDPIEPGNEFYEEFLAEWNRGQDLAPYRLKREEARSRDPRVLRPLSGDEEVEIGETYVTIADLYPVQVQSPAQRGGWICLHLSGELNGNQRRYLADALAVLEAPENP